jgi:hypothetical protein
VNREGAPAKARRYLTEGRLIITAVGDLHVSATCRGDGTIHRLGYRDGVWFCSCPALTDRCSHLSALRMVVAVDLVF